MNFAAAKRRYFQMQETIFKSGAKNAGGELNGGEKLKPL